MFSSNLRALLQPFALAFASVTTSLLVASPASADETRYQYDRLGRLVHVEQVNGLRNHDARYTYDVAGNRKALVVTGSANGAATGMIVTPLGGHFVVLPFNRE